MKEAFLRCSITQKGISCCDITILNSCYGYRTLCSIDKTAKTAKTTTTTAAKAEYWSMCCRDSLNHFIDVEVVVDDNDDGLTHRSGTTTVHVDSISGQFIVCLCSSNKSSCVCVRWITIARSENKIAELKWDALRKLKRFNWRNCNIFSSNITRNEILSFASFCQKTVLQSAKRRLQNVIFERWFSFHCLIFGPVLCYFP